MSCHHHHARRRRSSPCRLAAVVLVWSVAAGYTVFRLVEMALTDPQRQQQEQQEQQERQRQQQQEHGEAVGGSGFSLALRSRVSPGADGTDNEFPAITLCNINPARGSKLVNMPADRYNVSNAYESLVDFMKHRSPARSSHIPIKVVYEQAGHSIAEMLKSCQFNNKSRCDAYDFDKSVTLMGMCYTLHPEAGGPETSSVKMLLDPQGYDYLLPNEGFVGLTVVVHSLSEPLVISMDQSLQVGPKFHTTIHVTASSRTAAAPCASAERWRRCANDCFAAAMRDRCKCRVADMPYCTLNDLARCGLDISDGPDPNWLRGCRCQQPCKMTEYRIQSVVQTPRSPLLSRLQTIKERSSLTRKVAEVQEANLVQQWAFLREANGTAFALLQSLSRLLTDIDHLYSQAVSGLRNLSMQWSLQFVEGRTYDGRCMVAVRQITEIVNNMRTEAQRVPQLKESIFFEPGLRYPNSDMVFRVVNVFYKYSVNSVHRQMDEFRLRQFSQYLMNFDVKFGPFKIGQCSGGSVHTVEQLTHVVKNRLSENKNANELFCQQFADLHANNEAIRLAYPSSKSKIKQVASPKSQSSFVTLTVKLQKKQRIGSLPTAVRIVKAETQDRVMMLVTSTLSVSLFLTLIVHLLSKLRCRQKPKPAPKGCSATTRRSLCRSAGIPAPGGASGSRRQARLQSLTAL